MSWFDTSGLASLAKNALKEAQKQIDKALDIQDEEEMSPSPPRQLSDEQNKSKTVPTTPMQPLWQKNNSAIWGSFTGSFFDNPKADEMVTTPPKSGSFTEPSSSLSTQSHGIGAGLSSASSSLSIEMVRRSIHSNSDSVELLSSPTTPGGSSGVTTPSATVNNSESVELITTSITTASSEMLTPDSMRSPDSVEIISSEEALGEEDDDSMSFNTIMDDTIDASNVVTTPPSKSLLSMCSEQQITATTSTLTDNSLDTLDVNESFESIKTLVDQSGEIIKKPGSSNRSPHTEENCMDSQTLLSDSTQSFEDVQILDPSSEEKDLVKISNSRPPSEPTSADEIDTTTSSDIEIISNPNGDSSSTNSIYRVSPLSKNKSAAVKKMSTGECSTLKKGHCREPSEVSSHSDDSQLSSHSDMDKLLRRISELSEILETKEIRVVELERLNIALREKNNEYQDMLESKQKKPDHLESEEHTQRLSALEKKFQMSIRERDALREQLKIVSNELTTKIPKDALDKMVAEKDFMIKELREEGEKLSKQILQHSTIIKKLRAKEKESDSLLKKNKEQISELSEEVERLKKSLAAKEEVERSQIEAVHKLSSEKRKLDIENTSMKNQIEDLTSKLDAIKTSLDAAKKELQEKQSTHSELMRKSEALAVLEIEKKNTQTQNNEILFQLEDLRQKLKIAETGNTQREQKLRQENSDLLRKLEAAELRSENLTQEVSLATIPLVRQYETLQTTLGTRTKNWENQEKELVSKLEEAQEKLKTLANIEKRYEEEKILFNARINNVEERLSGALLKCEQMASTLQQEQVDFSLKEANYKSEIEQLKEKLENSLKELDGMREKLKNLEKKLESQSEYNENSPVKSISTVAEEKSVQESSSHSSTLHANTIPINLGSEDPDRQENSSPTLSLGRNSLADSLASSAWQMDDMDCMSNSGRQMAGQCGSIYGLNFGNCGMGHTTAVLENLQATLKQRDGEISQLQWELSKLQLERNVLNTEISNLSLELENIKEKLTFHESLQNEFDVLQRQYDALLQMYGEKVEETQELELDLQDVKEMYKAQIDELLRQKNSG